MDFRVRESELCVELELESRAKHAGRLLGVVERGGHSHGNFLLSSVLRQRLKDGEGVCFVALLHPVSHYHYVGMKMGFNLRGFIDKHQVCFADFLKMTQERLMQSEAPCLGDDLIKWISGQVAEGVQDLRQRHERVTIVIDDVSVLLGLECSLKKIMCLLQSLLASVCKEELEGEKALSLVVLAHSEDDDEESLRLAAFVKHASHFFANVTPLRVSVANKI